MSPKMCSYGPAPTFGEFGKFGEFGELGEPGEPGKLGVPGELAGPGAPVEPGGSCLGSTLRISILVTVAPTLGGRTTSASRATAAAVKICLELIVEPHLYHSSLLNRARPM